MSQLHKALASLHRDINAGGEFPDALFRVRSEFGVSQSELTALYDANAEYKATCPQCGGHAFRMYVLQRISVEFDAGGDHEVCDGPAGDMEFGDTTEAICNDCGHSGLLGSMK